MAAPRRIAALLLLPLLLATGGVWADGLVQPGALAGRVSSDSAPLVSAAVYAYQLAELKLWKGVTDEQGRFRFDGLPAGLYKIIAAKNGFLPAVVELTRSSAGKLQWVDVELREEPSGLAANAGFWSVREQVPPDVLHELGLAGRIGLALSPTAPALQVGGVVQAHTGVDQSQPAGAAQLTGGRVDLNGEIREIRLALEGDFSQLQPAGFASSMRGSTQEVVFNLEGRGESQVELTSINNSLHLGDAASQLIGLESHRISWSQPLGEGRSTSFAAQYVAESNFYGFGAWSSLGVPSASRSWRVEGSFAAPLTERASFETGFRYREHESRQTDDQGLLVPSEQIEIFGRGGLQVSPGLLVEYGLFSTLRDGSVWLTPRGGVVLQLGPSWQAGSSISSRVQADGDDAFDMIGFTPAYFGEDEPCEHGEEQLCYRIFVARQGEDSKLSVGATHRTFAETLRLHFDRDFYNFFESLYLVDGDAVPELNLELEQRLAPGILARLESNLAAGGGGILMNAGHVPYENQVRYLVTSIDTQFERTATGLFLSFHHLAQDLTPAQPVTQRPHHRQDDQSLERLQVMLTQDLDVLRRLASDLALQLNMEVSRGSLPSGRQYDEPDELRRRVTGGVTVKF